MEPTDILGKKRGGEKFFTLGFRLFFILLQLNLTWKKMAQVFIARPHGPRPRFC
jgi:hypothetical protein